jgi:hypothetical protein
MLSPSAGATALPEEKDFSLPSIKEETRDTSQGNISVREISAWMRSLGSFFNLYNHPLAEGGQANLLIHDWTSEVRIVRATLLRCSQLVFQSVHFEKSDNTIFDETEANGLLNSLSAVSTTEEVKTGVPNTSLLTLAAALSDACASCQSLLEVRPVNLHAWVNLGEVLERHLRGLEGTRKVAQLYSHQQWLNVPAPLLDLVRRDVKPAALASDILLIFSSLFRLLDYLSLVETFLRQDQSLKQTLPIFTLVHEEARSLSEFVENRALQNQGLEKNLFDALDSMNYAIGMELRKVFGHELVGTSELQQAPLIYVKVENAHGLLRDSFQQSVVGLVQLYNPELDGAHLFNAFRTKREQSIALRRDLWTVLHLVRRCESEPDSALIDPLLKKLAWFRDGSLRYLMFKDWESCERFMEEIDAARHGRD